MSKISIKIQKILYRFHKISLPIIKIIPKVDYMLCKSKMKTLTTDNLWREVSLFKRQHHYCHHISKIRKCQYVSGIITVSISIILKGTLLWTSQITTNKTDPLIHNYLINLLHIFSSPPPIPIIFYQWINPRIISNNSQSRKEK